MAGHVFRVEEERSAFKILTGTPIGKIPIEKRVRSWGKYIRMKLKEIVVNTRNRIHSLGTRIIGD